MQDRSTRRRVGGVLVVAALLGLPLPAAPTHGAPAPLLRLVGRIALPDVEGRLDHLALDRAQQRLFVAALGNGSVEVIDLAQGRHERRLDGLREPQGVLALPGPQRLFVTLGEGAAVAVWSGPDLSRAGKIATREDPDNIRYEAEADRVWVGAGSGSGGALLGFAPADTAVRSEIALDGHPESFQLEAGGPRIFVNVPDEREIEVVDRARQRVVARWKLPHAANFPMALDEAHRRLFVACRRPARILLLDTDTGASVADVPAPADADDLFLDAAAGRLYVSAGEGLVRIYAWRDADRLEPAGDVETGRGARTSLLDVAGHRLYVAVPRRGTATAEIQVFDTSAEREGADHRPPERLASALGAPLSR